MLNGIEILPEKFPGIDNIPVMQNLRSIGIAENRETFGAGFMRKEKGPDFLEESVDHYALVFILKGEGRYLEEDGTVHTLHPGMAFQRLPGKKHSNFIDSTEEWFEGFLAIGRYMYESLKAMGIIDADKIVVAQTTDQAQKLRIIRQFYHIAMGMNSFEDRNTLSFLTDEIKAIQELLNIELSPPDVFESFCEMVSQEPALRINIREYCREQSIGYEWFRKAFKEKMGLPPTAFALEKRMERAMNLLYTSYLPLYRIADVLGYKNQYEFSAQFKKRTGLSPSAFRQSENCQ